MSFRRSYVKLSDLKKMCAQFHENRNLMKTKKMKENISKKMFSCTTTKRAREVKNRDQKLGTRRCEKSAQSFCLSFENWAHRESSSPDRPSSKRPNYFFLFFFFQKCTCHSRGARKRFNSKRLAQGTAGCSGHCCPEHCWLPRAQLEKKNFSVFEF